MGVSLLDQENAWAVGMNGSIWSTADGAATWTALNPPADSLEEVVRVNETEGWVLARNGDLFWTVDGGQHWSLVKPPDRKDWKPRRVDLPGGREVIAESENPHLNGSFVHLDDGWTTRGADALVRLDAWPKTTKSGLLEIFEAGRMSQAGPVRTVLASEYQALSGVGKLRAGIWWGWTRQQVFLSYDAGLTWLAVSVAPSADIHAVVFLNRRRALLQTVEGDLFTSNNAARDWTQSEHPQADLYDWKRTLNEPAPSLPIECLRTAVSAELKVGLEVQGCFGGSSEWLSLEWGAGGTKMAGSYRTTGSQVETVESTSLSSTQARRAATVVVDAALRPEIPSECRSTTKHRVTISWECRDPSGQALTGGVSYDTNDCPSRITTRITGAETRSGSTNPEGYARALGVSEAARGILLELGSPP